MSKNGCKSKFLKRSLAYLRKSYLLRIRRIVYHLTFKHSDYKIKSNNIIEWFFDLGFYIFDLILLPEIYEGIVCLQKTNYRFLTEQEKNLTKKYFGKSIDLEFVRINSQMTQWIEKKAHAYVTFNTINYRHKISKPVFLHEMVHIWQYQRFGSMYIYRALKAQNSKQKYDYGGLEYLYASMIKQEYFINFNFEQQGSIIEDYIRLIDSSDGFHNQLVSTCYEYFISQLKYK